MNTKQDKETLRYIYLGLVENGYYTVLTTELDPQQIIERDLTGKLQESSFACKGTSWGGYDALERTCMFKKIAPVNHITLKNPLTFSGNDWQHGKRDPWTVVVVEIITVEGTEDEASE